MKLNKEQIVELYKFTQQHFVEWYDLQTELVDHLANDIENIWKENPNLTFDQAKNLSFKKFGVLGFNDVIADNRKALNKKYWLLVWKYFKEFFTPPKIIFTFLIFEIIYLLFKRFEYKEYLLISFLLVIYFTIFISTYNHYKRNKVSFIKSGKKWLIQENIKTMGGFTSILGLPLIVLSQIYDELIWTELNILISSVIIVFIGLTVYILTQIIPLKLEEKIIRLYPEYNLYKKA